MADPPCVWVRLQLHETEFWKITAKELKTAAAKETMNNILTWIRMRCPPRPLALLL